MVTVVHKANKGTLVRLNIFNNLVITLNAKAM